MKRSAHGPRRRTGRAGGFTLIEALLATTVLAFVVAAMSQTIVAGQMQTYDAMHAGRATALAEALMEEVLVLGYDDPGGGQFIGPDDGETQREDFDDIDDFHGFEEEAGGLADAAGNVYPDVFQGLTRRVTVTADEVDVPAFDTARPGLTVTVTVQEGTTGREWTVSRFVPEPAE